MCIRDSGKIVLGDSTIGPDQVADEVVKALHSDAFYILPHPEVADYYAARAAQPDRWLNGMRRLQAKADALGEKKANRTTS